jgi:hypothetical protein
VVCGIDPIERQRFREPPPLSIGSDHFAVAACRRRFLQERRLLTFRWHAKRAPCAGGGIASNAARLSEGAGEPRGCSHSAVLLTTCVHERILGEPLGYQCGIVDEDQ